MLTYNEWKKDADLTIPGKYHIDNELILVRRSELIRVEAGPFIADRTIAIILKIGSLNLSIDMKEYHIESPCMVTILPKQTFKLFDCTEDLDGSTIMMSNNFLNGMFSEYSAFSNLRRQIEINPITSMVGKARMEKAFYQYLDMLENLVKSEDSPYKLEAARHLTLSMFYGLIFALHNLETVKPRDRQTELFYRFEKELKENYRQQREVNFYSDKLCISPKYLSSVILEQTGKSARTVIHEYVANECQALLLSTDLTIQQISSKLNFSSQGGFCKFFKRITGLSPREYRKNIQK